MTACKSCKTLSNPYVSLLIGQIHGLGNSLRRNFAFSIQIHLFTVILSPLGLLPSMPRHGPSNTRDQTVWNAFIESRPPSEASAMLTSCKFCIKYSNHLHRSLQAYWLATISPILRRARHWKTSHYVTHVPQMCIASFLEYAMAEIS